MNSDPTEKNYAGILPKKGWAGRNYRFLRYRLIPQIFQKAEGETHAPILDAPAVGQVRVTWIGHASFFVQFADHSILIDPNWARWHGLVRRERLPGLRIDDVPEVDLILVSHAHFDHLHKPSLRILQARDGIVVPTGSRAIVKRLGFSSIREMTIWESIIYGDMEVIHTPSHHWGARYLHDTHRDYGGYIVKSGGRNIFHAGDSAYFEGFKDIGQRERVDIALLPIGAYDAPSGRDVHMNPEEAVKAFIELGASLMIPMHYATFPLGNEQAHEPAERLLAEAKRLGVADRIIIPHEGEAVEV